MRDPRTGLRFEAPRNWTRRIRQNPGMFRIASGGADISGWAYFRVEPLPKTDAELTTAREALVKRAKERNPSFKLIGARNTKVQGFPAVEVAGTQRIFGSVVATRSIHVYRGGEYVFEVLAPPGQKFDTANKRVFEPLMHSLEFAPLPGA